MTGFEPLRHISFQLKV